MGWPEGESDLTVSPEGGRMVSPELYSAAYEVFR